MVVDVRSALLDAAISVFAAAGNRGATTRRIAQEAGVNEVTLFRHFRSKDDLIHAALERYVSGIERRPLPEEPGDPRAELLDWSRAHYRELLKHRSLIRKVMGEREENPGHCALGMKASASINNELTTYFTRLKKAGLASGTWDERAAASMLMGTLFSDAMGRDTMPERYPYSQREAVEWYVDLMVRAIGAQAPTRRARTRG